MGYIQASSSFILIIFYTITKKNLVIKKAWREFTEANENEF